MEKENIFCKLESFLREPINIDIINILMRSGYDCKLALLGLNKESVEEIETYANKNRSVLENTSYQNMKEFSFKPGHKCIIIDLPNQIRLLEKAESDEKMQYRMSDFSLILKTFIETAELNHGRDPKGYRYNDINRFFSTFIYLFCGRACYDTLCANLPIPQTNTIRKFSNLAVRKIQFSSKNLIE